MPGLWSSCLSLAIFRSCACWDCSRSMYCYIGQGHEHLPYQRVNDHLHIQSKERFACCTLCGVVCLSDRALVGWKSRPSYVCPLYLCFHTDCSAHDNAYRKKRRVCVINCLWVFNSLRSWRLLPEGAQKQPPRKTLFTPTAFVRMRL